MSSSGAKKYFENNLKNWWNLFIAILHIGFILNLANLSFALCFGAYIILLEFNQSTNYEPKSYINIFLELIVTIHVAIIHMIEIGTGKIL